MRDSQWVRTRVGSDLVPATGKIAYLSGVEKTSPADPIGRDKEQPLESVTLEHVCHAVVGAYPAVVKREYRVRIRLANRANMIAEPACVKFVSVGPGLGESTGVP